MNLNFKTSFYLRSNYVNRDGKSTIMMRIYLEGKRVTLGSTGIAINPLAWDKTKGCMRGRTTEALNVNLQLSNIQQTLLSIYNRMDPESDITLEKIKAEYQSISKEITTIMQLFNKYDDDLRQQIDVKICRTTYLRYEKCKERLQEMMKKQYKRSDLMLNEVTPLVVHDFEVYLRSKTPLGHNQVIKSMKLFKTIVLFGKKLGLIAHDPFIGVKFHLQPVDRGYLTEEEVYAIMNKEMPIKRIELVRDIFIFACFTGLAYVDVANLRKENIVTLNGTDWIKSSREKTSTPINVVLLDIPKRIIAKYENDPRNKGMLFPIFSNQKMNAYLKEIADICGIEKNLTFHLARHTFATMALSKGASIESVSKMLGHTNIKTTMIYARITDKKIEHDMNELAGKLSLFEGPANNIMFKEKSVNMKKGKSTGTV
jgi:integrase